MEQKIHGRGRNWADQELIISVSVIHVICIELSMKFEPGLERCKPNQIKLKQKVWVTLSINMLQPLTVPVTLHLGDTSRERRPHFLGSRQPASSLQQRGALLEVLPRLPQAAARRTSQRTHRPTRVINTADWLSGPSVASSLFLLLSLQVIKDSMRNKADLTDMSRMWVRKQIILTSHDTVSQGPPYSKLKERFMSCCRWSDPRNVY